MANRNWVNVNVTPEKGLITLYVPVAFNSTSAPSLLQWNTITRTYAAAPAAGCRHGAVSFVRNSAGNYTLTLQDTYQRCVELDVTIISSANPLAGSPAIRTASNPNLSGSTVAQGLGTAATSNSVNFLLFSSAGTPADSAATELGIIKLVLQNSSAP